MFFPLLISQSGWLVPWRGHRSASLRYGGGGSERLEPAPTVGRLAAEQAEVELLQATGDRAALAVADLLAVDRADRRDFSGRAAHQDLIGEVEVLARQVAFDHLDTFLAGEGHQRVARDAGEDGCAR